MFLEVQLICLIIFCVGLYVGFISGSKLIISINVIGLCTGISYIIMFYTYEYLCDFYLNSSVLN